MGLYCKEDWRTYLLQVLKWEEEAEDLLYDEVPTATEEEAEDLLYDEVPTAAKEEESSRVEESPKEYSWLKASCLVWENQKGV